MSATILTRPRQEETAPAADSRQKCFDLNEFLEGLELECVYHRSFAAADIEDKLWGSQQDDIPVCQYNLLREVPDDQEDGPMPRTSLSRQEEQTLFLQYNYAKFRLRKLLEVRPSRISSRRWTEMTVWKNRALRVRAKIVHANLPLVPSMARRVTCRDVEFSEMLSEGYMAVLRCVEKFNVARGFKFSTYACRAILACFYRMGTKAQTLRKHIPAQFDPEMEQTDFGERRHQQQRADAIEAVREVLFQNSAELSEIERTVIQERFPVLRNHKARTLSEVGRIVGLSNERVRQIENVTLEKLRSAILEHSGV